MSCTLKDYSRFDKYDQFSFIIFMIINDYKAFRGVRKSEIMGSGRVGNFEVC